MSIKLQKVKAIQDEDCHWYVVPEHLLPFFMIDQGDETMVNNGQFHQRWGKYMTGGDIN